MNKEQLVNLVTLRNYINDKVAPEHFDMKYFRADSNFKARFFKSFNDCGTVGCALGWLPFALNEKYGDSFKTEVYTWGPSFFWKLSDKYLGISVDSGLFDHLFGSDFTYCEYSYKRLSGKDQKQAFIERVDKFIAEKSKKLKEA